MDPFRNTPRYLLSMTAFGLMPVILSVIIMPNSALNETASTTRTGFFFFVPFIEIFH